MTTTVIDEPRTYGPANPEHSWFQDVALSTTGEHGSDQARARLLQHALEVDVEIKARSREGVRANREREFREHGSFRAESRAANSTTLAGFTTPNWLTEQWAAFRSPPRTFTNQTFMVPLSPFGLQVNVPSFSGPAASGQQSSENQAVGGASPTGADLSTSVTTQLATVVLSQQLYDRGGATGLGFDMIMGAQLKSQLDAAVDLYVLNQAISGATSVSDSTSYTNALFYQDIAKAREGLTDTSGTRLVPTHLFSTSDLYSFVSRQVDDDHRPIFTPDWSAEPWSNYAEHGDDTGKGWLGHILPGNIAWFADDNIPASGSNTQIIVARPQEMVTFEADPVVYAWPETYGPNLSVLVSLVEYVAAVARFPLAFSVISGNTYPTSLV